METQDSNQTETQTEDETVQANSKEILSNVALTVQGRVITQGTQATTARRTRE